MTTTVRGSAVNATVLVEGGRALSASQIRFTEITGETVEEVQRRGRRVTTALGNPLAIAWDDATAEGGRRVEWLGPDQEGLTPTTWAELMDLCGLVDEGMVLPEAVESKEG